MKVSKKIKDILHKKELLISFTRWVAFETMATNRWSESKAPEFIKKFLETGEPEVAKKTAKALWESEGSLANVGVCWAAELVNWNQTEEGDGWDWEFAVDLSISASLTYQFDDWCLSKWGHEPYVTSEQNNWKKNKRKQIKEDLELLIFIDDYPYCDICNTSEYLESSNGYYICNQCATRFFKARGNK